MSLEDSAGAEGADWRDRATERSLRGAREKAELRSERYMRTAIAILSETGRTDFTLQELVERSRTSLRTFYQHFSGKDELLVAMMEEVMGQATRQWRAASAGLDPVNALRTVVHEVYRRTLNVRFGGLNRAMSSFNLYLSEARPADYRRVLVPLHDLIGEIIARGVRDATFRRDVDPADLTRVVTQVLVGAAQLNAVTPGRPDADPEVFWQLLLAGVTAPSPERTVMKVVVDYSLCESNGVCMSAAPEIFELREDDTLHLLRPDVPEDLLDAARRAVVGCPRQAITLRP